MTVFKCKGYLLYNRVIILDYLCANKIYWSKYYGTFLGVLKPKDTNIKAPLELSLFEALYLLEKEVLNVYMGSKKLDKEELISYSTKLIPRFKELYMVYRDLREKGLVLRRGLKFGCDYLVYEHGPGIDHAPYGLQVLRGGESIDPIDLVRMGRLLHSVRKKLVIALIIGRDNDNIKYLLLKWWKP